MAVNGLGSVLTEILGTFPNPYDSFYGGKTSTQCKKKKKKKNLIENNIRTTSPVCSSKFPKDLEVQEMCD